MKRIMSIFAVIVVLLMVSCSHPTSGGKGTAVTLNFGISQASRSGAVYPFTPGDGTFHSKVKYRVQFVSPGVDPTVTMPQGEPIIDEKVNGGGTHTFRPPQGTYDVYVSALFEDVKYAGIEPGGTGVTSTAGRNYIVIDTATATSPISVPMKVTTPVFYDFSTSANISEISDYIINSPPSPEPMIYVAVELDTANWQAILSEVDIGNRLIDLNLKYCTTISSGHVFNPYSVTTTTGKDKINIITLPLDADSIAAGSLGTAAFADFDYLKAVYATDSITSIGDYAFSDGTNGLLRLETVSLPEVAQVGNFAFLNCPALSLVSIGNNADATHIGVGAFTNCAALHTAVIPGASIDIEAFAGCISLTTLTIPYVTYIGDRAFMATDGANLAIYCTAKETPPNLGITIFFGVSVSKAVNVFVPSGSIGSYDATWQYALNGLGTSGLGTYNPYINVSISPN